MLGQYTRVCDAADIEEGTVKSYRVEGRDIILAKYQGEVFALENLCSHDGGELGEGSLIEGQVMCPRHGARFDIKTGDAKSMPAAVGIGTYPVKIDQGAILVDLEK